MCAFFVKYLSLDRIIAQSFDDCMSSHKYIQTDISWSRLVAYETDAEVKGVELIQFFSCGILAWLFFHVDKRIQYHALTTASKDFVLASTYIVEILYHFWELSGRKSCVLCCSVCIPA